MTADSSVPASKQRVVVIGGGFGGMEVVKRLQGVPGVAVTLVDARNFHLFQPLTYQVATGTLSPSDITYPLRSLFGSASNVDVMLAEVRGFDLAAHKILLAPGQPTSPPPSVDYDTLVVAAGSSYSYFGHEEWREVAGEVKSLESAVSVRARVLTAFERAEIATSERDRVAAATFVIVGGGPTGVELAGQIGELARDMLHRDYKRVHSGDVRILLVEMADRVLTAFPESLSAKASRALRAVGVTPTVNRTVIDIDTEGVSLRAPDGSIDRVSACTVIWAAGVRASGLATKLGEQAGAAVDRAGRVTVGPDLTLDGHPEVIVLGDMARVRDEHGELLELPGLAPVAIQQGHYAARLISHRLTGRSTRPFRYFDKGNLATIGRGRAVAELGPVRLSGPLAWLIWLGVHIWYLIGYQNRLVVMMRWSISFLSHGRAQGTRIIAGEAPPKPACAVDRHPETDESGDGAGEGAVSRT